MICHLAGCFSRPWCIEEWYKARGLLESGKPETPPAAQMRTNSHSAGKPHTGVKHKIADKGDKDVGMNVNFSGIQGKAKTFIPEPDQKGVQKEKGIHILESFYYADEFTEKMIPYFGKFLLDSGAFTMFSDKKKAQGLVWEQYVDKYADFIVRNNIKHFFELDIDKLVGYDKVLQLRNRLESKAGRPCIPVWHKFRGKDKFLEMVDQYKYVAIGGIVSKEITPDNYKFFPWFINEAHKRGAKIHGLGFTALASLPKYHFDSVDSTSWTTGNRFGAVYRFDGKTIIKIGKGEGQRLKDSRAVAINNFNEWVKFQKYAEVHL